MTISNSALKLQQEKGQYRPPYRVQLLQKAIPRLPVTAEGLPIGFYRVDLLPEVPEADAKEEVQALRNAYIDLNFEHGYPTLPNGQPFWYKLDFEPGFAFGAFQIYLEAINEGPRQLAALASNEEIRRLASSLHQYSNPTSSTTNSANSGDSNTPESSDGGAGGRGLLPITAVTNMLYEFSILYLWKARAQAFDLYTEAAYRHLKLRRQTSAENEHFLLAANLLNQLKEKVLDKEDFFKDMSPKVAIDLLTKLVAIQRVSTGLPATGPLPNKEVGEDVSFEMIMRSLGQKVAQGNVYDQSGREVSAQNALSKVLEDPHAAGMMQEVIIRVTKASQNQEEQGKVGNRFKSRDRTQESISSDDLTVPFDISGAPGVNLDADSDPNPSSSSETKS